MSEEKKKISGQLFFRDVGSAEHLPEGKGKKLMAVTGIIAVDNDTDFYGEHQYCISGEERAGVSQIDIHMRLKRDLTGHVEGKSLNQLLTMQIWRI